MRVRLSVVDPRGGSGPVDVEVTADTGTPAGQACAPVLAAVGQPEGTALYVEGTVVDDRLVLGLPPLVEGAVVTVGRPGSAPGRAAGTTGGLLELHVAGGPDAGRVHRLLPGRHLIGRAADTAVHLEDVDVSRRHASLDVSAGGVTVRDLGSTNGTWLDGAPLGDDAAPLAPGSRLRIGSSTLLLRLPDASAAATSPRGDGLVDVNRAPRVVEPVDRCELRLPPPPSAPEPQRVPVLAMVLPVVVAVPLALIWSPLALLFGLTTPVLMLGNLVGDRRSGRRRHERDLATHGRLVERVGQQADAALALQAQRLRALAPDAAEISGLVAGPTTRLWERRPGDPDFLHVRVGSGTVRSSVVVLQQGGPHGTDERHHHDLDDVPVTLALGDLGVVGVCGPRARTVPLVRSLVAQLAALHSPRDVRLVVLAPPRGETPEWAWTRWLPHLRPAGVPGPRACVGVDSGQVRRRVDELSGLVTSRREDRRTRPLGAGRRQHVVVLLDGARRLRAVPGVAALLAEGPEHGVHLVCLDETAGELPVECAATVHVHGEVGSRVRVVRPGDGVPGDVTADLVPAGWAERVARSLAPLRDATPDEDAARLPDRARLLDVLGLDETAYDEPGAGLTPEHVAATWRQRPRCTRAVLGVTVDGVYGPDLRQDGPHVLVAGTTGSGKSELLQTLIASLALVNRPDEMVFVLVDYKGGAAFADCAGLPHVVGVVTDLDAHLTRRALVSLGAELRRRERLLRDHGAPDLERYHALQDAGSGAPSLPRLVLVIDEFRVLAEELPDFLAGLVRLAAVGRSLGVHLVLATQRPAGVVSADITANVNLRIALRVRDEVDSVDVVDVRDAASISPNLPGRALARTASSPLVELQAARVGGRAPVAAGGAPTARPLEWARLGDPEPPDLPAGEDSGPTDLARVAEAVRGAADLLGVASPRSPWLPPLPDVVDLAAASALGPPAMSATALLLGVADEPAAQAQRPLLWDPATDGCLLVVGTARTGRTSLLRTLAASASRTAPADLHLHAVDGSGGGLHGLTALPHTGAVVGRQEPARLARLLARLVEEVARRRVLLAETGHGSLAELRHAGPAVAPPYVVLLVDGWEAVQRDLEETDHGRPLEHLLQLLREGQGAGVLCVLTGDRGLLTGRVGAAVGETLLLRTADPTDAVLAGVPAREVPERMPPGRALHLTAAGVREVQVALPVADTSGPAQQAALARLAAAATARAAQSPPACRPFTVRPLPDVVALTDVLAAERSGRGRSVPLGLGGEDVVPVGLDLADTPAAVVAGPPGSGRSTTLVTAATGLGTRGVPVVLVCPRPSPLTTLRNGPGVLGCFATEGGGPLRTVLDDAVARGAPAVVVVDDAEVLDGTAVEAVLLEVLARAAGSGEAVVLAGSTAELGARFRGLAVEARRCRTGVLLSPTGYADGELLGVQVPRATQVRPGRGLLVRRGVVDAVQVALPGRVEAPPAGRPPWA